MAGFGGNWLQTIEVGFLFGVGFHVAGTVLDLVSSLLRRSHRPPS